MVAALASVVVLASCGGGDEDADSVGVTTSDSATAGADTDRAPAGAGARKGGARNPGGTNDAGPTLAGDPAEARRAVESVDDVYRSFAKAVEDGIASVDVPARQTLDEAADNESLRDVCALMSKAAQKQTIVYAKRSAGLADVNWSCENATGLLLRRARQTGGLKRSLRAKVVGVNVDGDRATASLRFGRKGPISSVPMVKEDGEWKIGAAPAGGGG